MDSFDVYVYWLDQHLLANKIKEEQKYKTVLLLLIISKDENAHPENAHQLVTMSELVTM